MRKAVILIVVLMTFLSQSGFAGIFDKSEYQGRRTKLMEYVPDGIAILIGSTEDVRRSNMIYFTGIYDPSAILVIDGVNKVSILFLPDIKKREQVIAETGVERVYPVSRLGNLLSGFHQKSAVVYTPSFREDIRYQPKGLIDPDKRLSRELNLTAQIKRNFPSFTFKNIDLAIAELRVIKSPAEIELLRESGRISSLAHIEVLRSAKPGMYEWELEAIFEYTIKRLGGQGFGYDPIIPSVPEWYDSHYSENSRKILDGDMVMPDVGGRYKDYIVDISATFPINGKFTKEQARLNRIICAVEDAMQKVFRPGIRSVDMKAEVQAIVSEQGIEMDNEGVYRILADHWIGLDVHDVIGMGIPSRYTVLKPGMVLASDPAIKIRDEDGNVIDGVKIENTVLITEDGCEDLTKLVPRTVEEIEKVMAEKGIHDYHNKNK